MATDDRLWCVVPAAGRGARYAAALPKQYVEIAGKPLLRWTLERLALHPRIAGLVLVLAADDAHWTGERAIHDTPLLTVVGGDQRADSVLAGLHVLSTRIGDRSLVLVHDAARPCVRASDIDALIEQGSASGGALLATPVRDTLKRADATNHVRATEPRDSLWSALTPQMFRLGELAAALQSARDAGLAVTDEAMAMEHAGFRPLLVAGHADNIKLTAPADKGAIEYFLLHGEGRTSS